MGFGHRIYKVRDPRGRRAEEHRGDAAPNGGTAGLRGRSRKAAPSPPCASTSRSRRLDTNVEYYTALLLEALEVPRSAFTALFAVGRAAGWCAHVFEQEKGGRLIRPQSTYVGPRPK